MIDAGWNLDIDKDEKNYVSDCGSSTFWGYRLSKRTGIVQASFRGSGTAKLNFGQCYGRSSGVTIVYLNGALIKTATKREGEVTVEFDYNPGDTLKLEEVNSGIIKISSLLLKCKGL